MISTSTGTNGVRLALHVSLLSMVTNLYIMVLKKEIGREQESYNDNFISKESLSLFWMLVSDTTSHLQLYFRNVLIITLSCSSVQHHVRYYRIAFTSFYLLFYVWSRNNQKHKTGRHKPWVLHNPLFCSPLHTCKSTHCIQVYSLREKGKIPV